MVENKEGILTHLHPTLEFKRQNSEELPNIHTWFSILLSNFLLVILASKADYQSRT